MLMFGGQVFGRNLPLNLLAVAYAMLLPHCPPLTPASEFKGYDLCPSSVTYAKVYRRLVPLTRRDSQRHHVGALVWTQFGRNTRSNETEKPHRQAG